MQIITTWTAGHADALRQALRMTNESFAEHLGVAVRTVASWRKRPEIVPQPAIQETLDAALERAPDRAKAQFALLRFCRKITRSLLECGMLMWYGQHGGHQGDAGGEVRGDLPASG